MNKILKARVTLPILVFKKVICSTKFLERGSKHFYHTFLKISSHAKQRRHEFMNLAAVNHKRCSKQKLIPLFAFPPFKINKKNKTLQTGEKHVTFCF
jgi:hypothetical protein